VDVETAEQRATSAPRRIDSRLVALGIAALAVGALRLHECGVLPTETGDIARNVLYGVAVHADGAAAAGEPLTQLFPQWTAVAWARFPYNYPPIALAFFTLVASISPSVFAAKLALTLIEAINACLIGRLTRSVTLAVLYWASPLSIWWVSREGQFEPLQAMFVLLAIAAATSRSFGGGLSLALGISTKVTAGALAPWFARETWRRGDRSRWLAAFGIALGLAPLVAAQWLYGGIANLARYSALLAYNPYYWNPFADRFAGNSAFFVATNEIASYGLLTVLVALAIRARDRIAYVAPIAFVAFCKVHGNVEFWYWLMLPAFLVPIPDRRWRFALIALCPLIDLHAIVELVGGPIGPNRFAGLPSVFDLYAAP
jgi:hypothetical protein